MKDREPSDHGHPEDSYSRQLDTWVLEQEKPYGYTAEPPAADTNNFNQRALESHNDYKPKRSRG